MRSIKILAISLALLTTACGRLQIPQWPKEVTYQLRVVIVEGVAYCFEDKIISVDPVKISEDSIRVPLERCDGLAGFKPDDYKKVLNYIADWRYWSDKHTCKLK
jgi:ethanolamine ammonia-lyase large subunit